MRTLSCDRCGGNGVTAPMGQPQFSEMVLGIMRFDLCIPCTNVVCANLRIFVSMDFSKFTQEVMNAPSQDQPEDKNEPAKILEGHSNA